MTPVEQLGTPVTVAREGRTPEADARLWLLCPDERHVAEIEGLDGWTERMRARWRAATRCGWAVHTTEYREREACAAAWRELVGGGGL